MELFSKLHRGQARFWHARQRQLFALVEALPAGTGMPTSIVEEIQQIDEFLQRASAAIVHIQRAHEREFEGLSTEQLEAQLSAEFVAAIATWTPAQWSIVEAARAKRIREAQEAQAHVAKETAA